MDFRISWEDYACYKKKKGCCGTGCDGCCYDPRFVKGTKNLAPWIVKELMAIVPENSPDTQFQNDNHAALQSKVCHHIQQKKATTATWDLYFGVGANRVTRQPKK